MAVVEILLALITVGVTVVIVILGSMYRELIANIKPTVQGIRSVLFGVNDDPTDDGLVHEVNTIHDKIEESAEERRGEHKQVETRLNRLQSNVDSIINAIHRSDKVDVNVDASNRVDPEND